MASDRFQEVLFRFRRQSHFPFTWQQAVRKMWNFYGGGANLILK